MARPRQSEQPKEDAPAAEAEAVEAQQQEAVAPTQVEEGGETAYSIDRLIAEAPSFLGCEPHVAAGALHGTDKEFLTIAEAKEAVEAWLAREVASSSEGGG